MSISASLFNAYSGLVAAARTTETISNNVANALTEGYGRRDVDLVAASTAGRGTGVKVAAITRDVDQIAVADRRIAQAEVGGKSVSSDALTRLERAIGIPGEGNALTDLVADFETKLISAQSRPDLQVRQQNLLYAAKDLTTHINHISSESQNIRFEADQSIAGQVDLLNKNLASIAELNRDIRLQFGAGHSMNGLMDQRQILVDQIADIIPLKTYPRDKGEIAVISANGAVLLDGQPAQFGFTPTGLITADMSLESGALSDLTLNGKSVSVSGANSLIAGGSLSAAFDVRDTSAPFASSQIDAFARNLMERFETTGLDPTTAAGDSGLFTDGGAAFDPADETGLAGRLTINSAVDPENGGELWRFRAGLGASTQGDVGDTTLITGFLDILAVGQAPTTGLFSEGESSLSEIANDLTSLNSAARVDAEQAEVFARGRFEELYLIELESGVDTDQEMQKLLLVEAAYAANARVITTVDQMLETILGL